MSGPLSVANQVAVFDLPSACPVGSLSLQPVKSLPLNNVMGLPQTGAPVRFMAGALLPSPLPGSSAGVGRGAHELATYHLPLELHVLGVTLFPFRRDEINLAVFHLDPRQRRRVIRDSYHNHFGLALLLGDFDPGGKFSFAGF